MGHHKLVASPLVVGNMPPTERKRRTRKPTLASVARQANKAGVEVARYEVEPDGKISVIPGQPKADPTNDFDRWLAKRREN
jgi:hypothetical protein